MFRLPRAALLSLTLILVPSVAWPQMNFEGLDLGGKKKKKKPKNNNEESKPKEEEKEKTGGGSSEVKMRGPGMYSSYYPGMMPNQNIFPNDCEIELDERGNEIRDDALHGTWHRCRTPEALAAWTNKRPIPARFPRTR